MLIISFSLSFYLRPLSHFGTKTQVAPAGPMYQAGTLSGNPLAMVAGIKTLEILDR